MRVLLAVDCVAAGACDGELAARNAEGRDVVVVAMGARARCIGTAGGGGAVSTDGLVN